METNFKNEKVILNFKFTLQQFLIDLFRVGRQCVYGDVMLV
jgi:hypothetical protein